MAEATPSPLLTLAQLEYQAKSSVARAQPGLRAYALLVAGAKLLTTLLQ